MPIFEYRCKDCETEFETLKPVHSNEVEDCPSCQSSNTVKLISVFSSASQGTKPSGVSQDSCACGSGGFT